VPRTAAELEAVAGEARACTRCPLYRNAIQTVFGEGPARAKLMLVGEQPGDQEDLAGRPFVGPAGKLLDRALVEAGIDRGKIYLTNAVKHFKNEPRGKKRLHKRPNRYETEICKVWIDKEISVVRPALILALGVTAAQSLTGRRTIVLSRERGRVLDLPGGYRGMLTTHPSALLRMPDETARRAGFVALVVDLKAAALIADA